MAGKIKRPSSPVFHAIGKTPLVPVHTKSKKTIWCKLEYFNPSGSIKDRIAWNILNTNYETIVTQHNNTVVEASSGNTSISLAMISKHMGLNFIAFLPETVSEERIWTLIAHGATPVLTPGDEGMRGAREAAKEFARTNQAYFANQFFNELNFQAHSETTAQEILEILHRVEAFVCGVGTGGTILGVYDHFSRKHQPTQYFVPVLAQAHYLHDIGLTQKGFSCLFTDRVADINSAFGSRVDYVEIEESEALSTAHHLWDNGYPVGPAAGVNFCAASKVAEKLDEDCNIVTVFTDRMDRYFSTEIFDRIKKDGKSRKEQQWEKRLLAKLKESIVNDPAFIEKLKRS